jgi:hypothetical protein
MIVSDHDVFTSNDEPVQTTSQIMWGLAHTMYGYVANTLDFHDFIASVNIKP